MALSIGGNYGMLRSLNNLRSTRSKMDQTLERISSGLKINSAADDAGGLAMGMKLSLEVTKTENLQSSVANAKSFVEAQSSALESASDVVSEMQTLKLTYDQAIEADPSADVSAYEQEFDDLKAQLNSLAGEKFNGEALFSSDSKRVSTADDGNGEINFGGINLESPGTLNGINDLGDLGTELDDALNEITGYVGEVGSNASSLGIASSYLETKATNLEAARSRIMDADIVEESTNLSKYTMQYEAAVAAIAQANSTQQTVMELLLFPKDK